MSRRWRTFLFFRWNLVTIFTIHLWLCPLPSQTRILSITSPNAFINQRAHSALNLICFRSFRWYERSISSKPALGPDVIEIPIIFSTYPWRSLLVSITLSISAFLAAISKVWLEQWSFKEIKSSRQCIISSSFFSRILLALVN